MRYKLGLKVLSALFILFAFLFPAFANANSVEDSVYDTVYYYKNNNTALSDWEEVIGLRGAGEDLSAAPWQLPDWKVDKLGETSPALDYAKTILGMLAAGQNPSDIEGRNLIEELADKQFADGGFGGALNQTIWSIIALDTAKADYAVNNTVTYLLDQQKSDGGFTLSGTTGDPDITGFALIALASHIDIDGVDAAIGRAQGFLQNIQLASGGFKSGTTENTESIAAVIRGLIACGIDITADTWKKNDQTMIDALLAFKLADGSFSHIIGGSSDSIATRQALIALADLWGGNVFYSIREGITPITKPVQETTVRVRVEGASASLADKTVTVTGTAIDALKAAVGEENLQAAGGFITRILGESGQAGVAEDTDTYWLFYVVRDGAIELSAFDLGADSYNIEDGDQIIFYIGAMDSKTYASKTFLPVITVNPKTPTAGQAITLTISARKYVWGSGLLDQPLENIKVIINGQGYDTSSGQPLEITAPSDSMKIRAEKYAEQGYPELVPAELVVSTSGEGSGPPVEDGIRVSVKVIGKDRETIAIQSVLLAKGVPHDPIEALLKTDLSVETSYGGAYVVNIEGLAEDFTSTAGWKYKVNGVLFDEIPARSYTLRDGDEVVWFYALDALDNGNSPLQPVMLQLSTEREEELRKAREQARIELNKLAVQLNNQLNSQLNNTEEHAAGRSIVVGLENPMTAEERDYWKKILNENLVSVSVRVDGSGSYEVKDKVSEVCLRLDKGSLKQSITIVVKEETSRSLSYQSYKIISPIYNFTPDKAKFTNFVYLTVKLPVEKAAAEKLALAWYDAQNKIWVAVPSVVDLANGEISGLVRHFTPYAVLERESVPEQIQQQAAQEQEVSLKSFADVGPGSCEWAQKEIEFLAAKGIVSGTGNNMFSPGNNVTRAEFVTMLANALGLKDDPGSKLDFSDTKPGSWYIAPVKAAVQAGIVKGYSNNTFGPDEPVTREQIAAILVRVLKLDPPSNRPQFKDQAQISPWACQAVFAAADKQLIRGFTDGTFRPAQPASRAQSAVIIYRLLQAAAHTGGSRS